MRAKLNEVIYWFVIVSGLFVATLIVVDQVIELLN